MTTIIGAPRELGGKFLKMGCGESGLYFRRSFSRAGFRHIAIDFIKYLNEHFGFLNRFKGLQQMKLKVVIHEAEEGGYWAEVPAIPGCMTQADSIKELIENLYDAVEGCLSIDMNKIEIKESDTVMELAV